MNLFDSFSSNENPSILQFCHFENNSTEVYTWWKLMSCDWENKKAPLSSHWGVKRGKDPKKLFLHIDSVITHFHWVSWNQPFFIHFYSFNYNRPYQPFHSNVVGTKQKHVRKIKCGLITGCKTKCGLITCWYKTEACP